MDSEVERTLQNLTVISMLKQHDKLSTTGETFALHGPTTWRSVYRRWYGEGRDANYQRLHECLHVAFAYISGATHAGDSDDREREDGQECTQRGLRRRRVLIALQGARRGLCNLMDTYTDDLSFKVRLQLLAERVDDFLRPLAAQSVAGSSSHVLGSLFEIASPAHEEAVDGSSTVADVNRPSSSGSTGDRKFRLR
jgi:hypothetical protein